MAITLVGDPAQELFGFNNSCSLILNNLEYILKDVQTSELRVNYRNPKMHVELSNNFSSIFEPILKTKEAIPFKRDRSSVLHIQSFENSRKEARWVAEEIKGLLKRGVPHKDIVVLARANRALLLYEEAFISFGIPYTLKFDNRSILSNSGFKFLFALYAYFLAPSSVEAFTSCFLALRGCGVVFTSKFRSAYLKSGFKSVPEFLQKEVCSIGTPKQNVMVQEFYKFLNSLLHFVSRIEGLTYKDINTFIFDGLRGQGWKDSEPDAGCYKFSFTLELSQVVRAMRTIEGIEASLQEDEEFYELTSEGRLKEVFNSIGLSQVQYSESKEGVKTKQSVQCQTVHSFKGLEAPYVFFVHNKSGMTISEKNHEMSCIFYVALTRATKYLYITWSENVLNYSYEWVSSRPNKVLDYFLDCIQKLRKLRGF